MTTSGNNDWILEHVSYPDIFPRPDWDAISKRLEEKYTDAELHEAWCDVARIWLDKTRIVW